MISKPWSTNLVQIPDGTIPRSPTDVYGWLRLRDVIRLRIDERQYDSSAVRLRFRRNRTMPQAQGHL